jgi:hypothetical protein
LVPSEREIKLTSAALAPPVAFGVELAVKGGQALAHAPAQLVLPLLSATQMYSARPEAPVRYVPTDAFAVPITSAPLELEGEDWLAYGDAPAAVDGLEAELYELPPHAASSSEAATAAEMKILLKESIA